MSDAPRLSPTQAMIDDFFSFEHLPAELQAISQPLCEVALVMETVLEDGPEKTAGFRKLLEAKDCFVRQRVREQKKAAATDG